MKDYLQLEGLAYKLVPIKTERENGFEMGRIDSDHMYVCWEWGNSGDPPTSTMTCKPEYKGVAAQVTNLAHLTETLLKKKTK
jgi:hypothetical protein